MNEIDCLIDTHTHTHTHNEKQSVDVLLNRVEQVVLHLPRCCAPWNTLNAYVALYNVHGAIHYLHAKKK